MKIQLLLLFIFCSFLGQAQNEANYIIYSDNDKVVLEAQIYMESVQTIVESTQYCEANTALSFCLRNYFAEKLSITGNGSESYQFEIEASLANSTKLQINLAVTVDATITEWYVVNNAFVDEIPGFKNNVTVKINDIPQKFVMDADNREITVE